MKDKTIERECYYCGAIREKCAECNKPLTKKFYGYWDHHAHICQNCFDNHIKGLKNKKEEVRN